MATGDRSETQTRTRTLTRVPPPLDQFTPTELRAAEQLVQLSESSAESDDSCSFSTSINTPKSVNTGPPLLSIAEFEEDGDDDEMGPRRKSPRYRLISDLYEATARIDGATAKNRINGGGRKRGDAR